MDAKDFKRIGMAAIFIGLGLQIALQDFIIGSVITTFGIVFFLRGCLLDRNPERLKKDERTRKIGAFAASWSWMITIVALCLFFWLDKLKFFELNVPLVIGATYIVMVASFLAFQFYFNSKGDVS